MKNLLNSTDIATLFLDKELNIRRYTNQATKIFKLIKSDIGRPFTDLVSDLIYPELATDSLEVLRTLVFIQKQIPAKDGRWFFVRIMPYRTLDDRIEGLVITFINISDLKHVEIKLQETGQINHFLLNSSSDVIVKLSTDLKILEFNPEAVKFFGKKREEVINENYIQLFVPEQARNKAQKELVKLFTGLRDGVIKLKVMTAGNKIQVVECAVNVLLSNLNLAAGMIIITKRKSNNHD